MAARLSATAFALAVLAAAAGVAAVTLENTQRQIAGSPVAAPKDQLVHGAREDPVLRRGQPGGSPPPPSSEEPPAGDTGQPQAPQAGDADQAGQRANQRPGTIRLPRGGTAALVRSEVAADGTLPIPNGVNDAAWWGSELNATAGATVLAGHVNWKGTTGPFAELWSSQPGDLITVVEIGGRTSQYRASSVLTLSKDELPDRAGELFQQRGPHRLVLVTCGGNWVGNRLGYDKNRIVIAEPVS